MRRLRQVRWRGRTGFTVLEMIVVLMVTGLAVSLAFQALGQYRRAAQAVERSAGKWRHAALAQDWFRESIEGLHAPVVEREGREEALGLSGSVERLEGMTLNPVAAGQGLPTQQVWEILRDQHGVVLSVEEAGHGILLLPLPSVHNAEFRFLDEQGEWQEAWSVTPRLKVGELPVAVLPSAIALLALDRDGRPLEPLVIASPIGARIPIRHRYEYSDEF